MNNEFTTKDNENSTSNDNDNGENNKDCYNVSNNDRSYSLEIYHFVNCRRHKVSCDKVPRY